MTPVRYAVADRIAVLEVDNPPVNALGEGVPEAIRAAVRRADADPGVDAIVIMGAGRTFIAGADVSALAAAARGKLAALPDLQTLVTAVESCGKPVVVAMHGTALGGGLELAMAATCRIATRDAVLGQPEVNLGIIPGAEGTQRLPRLVGVQKALEMCVTGKPVKAADALAAGLIDHVIDGDLRSEAMAFARVVAVQPRPPKTRDRSDRLGSPAENAGHFEAARALAAKTRPHQVAPLRAVDAIEAAATLPFDEGCRRERDLFLECIRTDQARALMHLFFAERAAARVNGLPSTASPGPLATVAIVGAGTMGSGIATACLNAGMRVLLKDSSEAAIEAGTAAIARNLESGVTRGRMSAEAAAERRARVRTGLTYEGFDEADVVVEAVFESLELKKAVFTELDGVTRRDAVLATNTSTLDIDAIAAATSRPDRVIGLHFFSPAHVMRLLEVVRGAATAPDVIATALAAGKRLGKVPVVVGNCRGFVGNRMMFPYMYEAQFLVEEGAAPEEVDRALTNFGMAMGIFAVDDMAGLDVAWRVRQEFPDLGIPGGRQPLVADRLYEMGRYGQKRGAGWYRYGDDRRPSPDPEVAALIRRTAADAGIPQRTFTEEEIVERCIYALVNEGARVLADGSAQRASDIDVIYANGYGFPAWRGGPMFYADTLGLHRIHARIVQFAEELGERWSPAPLLTELAASGRTFTARSP